MLTTALSRFRFIGNAEGTSYLVLLLIAMPLKYWADLPLAVTIAGALHGLLFTLYLFALLHVWIVKRWSFLRVLIAFLVAFIPVGTYILDAKLRKEE